MSEKEFNVVFSKRLRYYLNKYEMTQNELAKRLGVGTTSVYNWCNGIKSPRMDKVDAMCDIFNCRRSDLMEEKNNQPTIDYYINTETAKTAQEIFENDRVLFDVYRSTDKDRLVEYAKRLQALRDMEKGEE